MIVGLTIDGWQYPLVDFNVTESATPIGGDDTSGSVGTFGFSFPIPTDPDNPVTKFGAAFLCRKPFTFTHSEYGEAFGVLISVTENVETGLIDASGVSILGRLQTFNDKGGPVNATLADAFAAFCVGAGINAYTVEVGFPEGAWVRALNWTGERWLHMKKLAAAFGGEIATFGDSVLLRPVRTFGLRNDVSTAFSVTTSAETLAQFVEVNKYGSEWVTDGIVYPRGGWESGLQIFSVGAGEYVEHEIPIDGALTSIMQPVMKETVTRWGEVDPSGQYTIAADDGFNIKPAQWAAAGGSVEVRIKEDNPGIVVLALQGPSSLNNFKGEPSKSFDLAMAADESGSRFSSLELRGTGLLSTRETLRIPTGVGPTETVTEVGVTVDNIYIRTYEQAYRAALWAAMGFNGLGISASASLSDATSLGLGFGRLAGGRIVKDKRVFRVREVGITPGGVSLSADNDLTVDEVDAVVVDYTVGEMDAVNAGLTVRDVDVRGSKY